MKKILFIFALVLAFSCILTSCDIPLLENVFETFETMPEETTPEETLSISQGLAYRINEDGETCTITGIGNCTERNIYIGGYIGDCKVTSIDNFAFYSCSNLASVTILNSVTTIGYSAFAYCTSLTSVMIPESVITIGNGAFSKCYGLTSVTFANPSGWWYTSDANATSGMKISASDLSNPETAAQYLRSTYYPYHWHCTK